MNFREASYNVNNLNQYTSRTVPGAVDVLGLPIWRTASVWNERKGTMKTRIQLLLLALLGLLLTQAAQAYYNPATGRWLSRDPIEERGGDNLKCFAVNDGVNRHDAVGLFAPPGGGPPPGWPPPPPPEIDCSGYAKTFGAKPCTVCDKRGDRRQDDTYPERAKKICDGFKERYTDTPWQGEAACVAKCLIAAEAECQKNPMCDVRNCCRLMAHVKCYSSCAFMPALGMPKGGPALGWQELLPACRRLGLSVSDILHGGLF